MAAPPSPHAYKSLVYQRTLLDRLNFLRNLGLFCDVTLEVEGKLFRCHQVILAASSTFFQTLFTQQQAAIKQATPIDLPVVKATAFCQLLDFVYTSELSLSVSTAIDLLSAASLLQMGPLVEAVSHYLKTHVGDEPEKQFPHLTSVPGADPLCASPTLPSRPAVTLDRHGSAGREPSAFVLHDSGQYVQHERESLAQSSVSTPSPTGAHTSLPSQPNLHKSNLRLSPNAEKGRAPLDYGPPLVLPPLPAHQPGFRYGVRSLDGKGGVFPVPIEVGNPYNRRHEQRFECHVCYMRFTRSETLRDHMNIHTGEKPYTCKFCLKKFRHQRNLRTHERDCKDNKGSKWRRKYTETVKDALERIRSEKTSEQEESKVTEDGKAIGQVSGADLEEGLCVDPATGQRSTEDNGTITVKAVEHHGDVRGQGEPNDLEKDRMSSPDSVGGDNNLEIDETSPDVTMATGGQSPEVPMATGQSPDITMAIGRQSPDITMGTSDQSPDITMATDMSPDQLECMQRLQSLNQHGTPANRIRKHEARYSCPICLQTFTRSHNLKNHMLIHSDAKPFTCPRCCGEFRYKRNLKAHSTVCKGIISVQNTAHPARSMSGSEPDLDAPADLLTSRDPLTSDLDAPADGANFGGIRDLLTSDDTEDRTEMPSTDGVFSPSQERYGSPGGMASEPAYIRAHDGRIIAVKQESPASPRNGQAEHRDTWIQPEGNFTEERSASTDGSVEHIGRSPGGSAEQLRKSPRGSVEQLLRTQSPGGSMEQIRRSPGGSMEQLLRTQSPGGSMEQIRRSPGGSMEQLLRTQSPGGSMEQFRRSPGGSMEQLLRTQSPGGSMEQIRRSPGGSAEQMVRSPAGARKRKAAMQHRWDPKHAGVTRLPEQLQSYVIDVMGGGGTVMGGGGTVMGGGGTEEGCTGALPHPRSDPAQLEESALSQNENQIIKDFWAEVNRGLFPDDHFSRLGQHKLKAGETMDQWQNSRTPMDQWQGSRTPVDQSQSSRTPMDQSQSSRMPVDQSQSSRTLMDQSQSSRMPMDQWQSSMAPMDQSQSSRTPMDQSQSSRLAGRRQHLEIQTSPSIDPLRDGVTPPAESDSDPVQNWAGDKHADTANQHGANFIRSKGRGEHDTYDPSRVKVERQADS